MYAPKTVAFIPGVHIHSNIYMYIYIYMRIAIFILLTADIMHVLTLICVAIATRIMYSYTTIALYMVSCHSYLSIAIQWNLH